MAKQNQHRKQTIPSIHPLIQNLMYQNYKRIEDEMRPTSTSTSSTYVCPRIHIFQTKIPKSPPNKSGNFFNQPKCANLLFVPIFNSLRKTAHAFDMNLVKVSLNTCLFVSPFFSFPSFASFLVVDFHWLLICVAILQS